ncbi:MAG: hypothetical protein K2K48_07560 [Anaeroplasmataceae bacterium]|nr:hypothetical protein [Anaeroplasmataceae bacterium]MDE6415258.1 hypothetical protein [Anaeroplasmataceae bacterium]
MERKTKNLILKKGNIIELPEEVINILKAKEGEEIKLIYTEEMVVLMSPGKFGELLLQKF